MASGDPPGLGGVPRAGKVAARNAHVAWKCRAACKELERIIIHSDGGIGNHLRKIEFDRTHQARGEAAVTTGTDSASATVGATSPNFPP